MGLSPAAEEALPSIEATAGLGGGGTSCFPCALPAFWGEIVLPGSVPTPHLIALTAVDHLKAQLKLGNTSSTKGARVE